MPIRLLAAVLILGACAGSPKEATDLQASVMCRMLLKQRLKAPDGAKFPSADKVSRTAPGAFTVLSYVDAQNSFGANVRTNFECRVTTQGDPYDPANWKLVAMETH